MKKIAVRKIVLLTLVGVLSVSAWAGNSKKEAVAEVNLESVYPSVQPVPVYFTKDVSSTGLNTLYRKLSLSNRYPFIHEYAADSFLYNFDDSILAHKDSKDAVLPDLPRAFVQEALGSNSNLQYRAAAKKNSPVADWHDFRFTSCLCYDEEFREYMDDEECQAQVWYPSKQCREVLKGLHRYEKNIAEEPVILVLSKFKPNGAAAQNMLSGNVLPSLSVIPIFEWWSRRIADVDKQTFFITVLTDIADKKGKKQDVGIIGSTSFVAVQKAAFDLAHKVNPSVKWKDEDSERGELRDTAIFATAISALIPESSQRKYNDDDLKRVGTSLRLLAERGNIDYKIVSLDK